MTPKYPDIAVKLLGENGNAFYVIGKVSRAMRQNGIEKQEIDEFINQATSGDYDNLLRAVMDWVEVE